MKNYRNLLLIGLLLLLLLFVSCSSKSIEHSQEKAIGKIKFYNVAKDASLESYGIFNTSNRCNIYSIDGKKFPSRNKFFGFINSIKKSTPTEKTIALKPGDYSIGIEYIKSGYKPIYKDVPVRIEAGNNYFIGYYSKEMRIYFFVENKTTKKVVLGKKYVPEENSNK
jgi:hypothetical protein